MGTQEVLEQGVSGGQSRSWARGVPVLDRDVSDRPRRRDRLQALDHEPAAVVKPSYRPDDLYPHIPGKVDREISTVIRFLHDAAVVSVEQIVEATGLSREAVYAYLGHLSHYGEVERQPDGRYVWVAP